ncbi:hypothetical protein EJ04DRAFT_557692 [Polyplosphaeria fusca]|uniref:F-box domain-containing protein n=1 Tax=Polyplosphaeria fusca TaxID=682080 RepID=A0A9P4UVM5_9PLEO|nr:hypothetical protein EJ04DRAFT_557692 [Polyplosphaeria fusca]
MSDITMDSDERLMNRREPALGLIRSFHFHITTSTVKARARDCRSFARLPGRGCSCPHTHKPNRAPKNFSSTPPRRSNTQLSIVIMAKKKSKTAKSKTKKATPPGLPAAEGTPISTLPPELLTKVISYIPGCVKAVRQVCRGFRNCAWPAFGERIGQVKFDLRSRVSMSNLWKISQNGHLSPHIKYLRFAVGHIPRTWPIVRSEMYDSDMDGYGMELDEIIHVADVLDEGTMDSLHHWKYHVEYWFAEVWEWTPCYEHSLDSMEYVATSAQRKAIVDVLATLLLKFNNLEFVKYVACTFPEAFRATKFKILEEIDEAQDDMSVLTVMEPHGADITAMDILGVNILLCAISTADLKVPSLAIPVPYHYCQTLAMYTPRDIIEKVFASVEHLETYQLPDAVFDHHLNNNQEFILTSALAPKLKSLDWGFWFNDPGASAQMPTWATVTASAGNYAPLTHLTLGAVTNAHCPSYHPSFFNFLSKFGPTLKFLELRKPTLYPWSELVEFLASSTDLSLDRLTLDFNGLSFVHVLAKVSSKDFVKEHHLYQAAEKIVIVPHNVKICVEERFKSRRDDETVGKSSKARSK